MVIGLSSCNTYSPTQGTILRHIVVHAPARKDNMYGNGNVYSRKNGTKNLKAILWPMDHRVPAKLTFIEFILKLLPLQPFFQIHFHFPVDAVIGSLFLLSMPVGKKDTIEMVCLVLEDYGGEAFYHFLVLNTIAILISEAYGIIAQHLPHGVWDGKATF